MTQTDIILIKTLFVLTTKNTSLHKIQVCFIWNVVASNTVKYRAFYGFQIMIINDTLSPIFTKTTKIGFCCSVVKN